MHDVVVAKHDGRFGLQPQIGGERVAERMPRIQEMGTHFGLAGRIARPCRPEDSPACSVSCFEKTDPVRRYARLQQPPAAIEAGNTGPDDHNVSPFLWR